MPRERNRQRTAKLSEQISPALHRLMSSKIPVDGPEIAAVWKRYLQSRQSADFDILVSHYSPLVGVNVGVAMKGARELFAGRGGETTSNGFMGLMKEISRTTAYDPEKFPRFASVTIRRFIWLGRRDEEWCGQDRFYYLRQVERERETFAALHGRQPAHEELKIIVWNKWPSGHGARAALEWGNRQMDSLEGLGSDDLASIKSLIDDSTDVPDRRLVAAETLKIAQRGLARIERRVLRLILAGQSQIGISRQLGIGRERAQRLWNKVLWSLRSRPELASALGVRADPMPPKDRNGKYPPFHPSAAPLAA